MTTKKRNTEFVNLGVTAEVRSLVNAAAARAGALTDQRVSNHMLIRAAIAIAESHPDELALNLAAIREDMSTER